MSETPPSSPPERNSKPNFNKGDLLQREDGNSQDALTVIGTRTISLPGGTQTDVVFVWTDQHSPPIDLDESQLEHLIDEFEKGNGLPENVGMVPAEKLKRLVRN